MNTLGKLLTAGLAVLGLLVLMSIVGVVFALVGGLAVFLIWLLPIWFIARSDKTYTAEKIAWILAIVCLSWFAWVFYYFLGPIKPREDEDYDHFDDFEREPRRKYRRGSYRY